MARLSGGKLTNLRCTTAGVGTHGDGHGLYLQVRPGAAGVTRSWVYRYTKAGKETWLGLGPYPLVTLAAARAKAADARRLRLDGHDPWQLKHSARAELSRQQAEAAARSMTFQQCVDGYYTAHCTAWTPKHAREWLQTMATYVLPIIGPLAIGAIDTSLVMKVLEPLARIPNAQARVRRRLEAAIDWAKARGFFVGDNPARLRGHIDKLIPRASKIVRHYPAMPFTEVPAFLVSLRQREAMAARALELAILTASRSAEVLGTKWSEIDLLNRTWTIPPERMKSRRPHRVPLSAAAVALFDRLPRDGEYLFPGKGGRLHGLAMAQLMRQMKAPGSPHGFRSSFRDWCAERTSYAGEIAEAALAHVVSDATEAAYRRGDLFERRRRLMSDWADFCDGKAASGAEIVPLRATGG
jgi:integrase